MPAKKYQRPPFQRINLADADFSPSRQTSSPIIPYRNPTPPLTSSSSEDEEDDEDVQPIPDLIGNRELVAQNLPDLTETSEKVEEVEVVASDGEVENELSEDLETLTGNLEICVEVPEALKLTPEVVVEEECEPKNEIVKFENDPDIAEEDLEKFLEELDEEESKVEEEQPQRPTTLILPEVEEAAAVVEPVEEVSPESPQESSSPTLEERRLGKISPFWVPDADALNCMQCGMKFTVLKRRHHCRACGRVLCHKCCDMRACLEYLNYQEHRVCELCFRTLTKVMVYEEEVEGEAESSPRRRPNPNNPMEYCSTVPPPLQASPSSSQPPPSVLVPVLKREGSSKTPKKVMFSDGIRPGGELTALDEPPAPRVQRSSKRVGTPPGSVDPSPVRVLPPVDPSTQSFIVDQGLPPVCQVNRGQISYQSDTPIEKIMEQLSDSELPPLLFAVNRHLIVSLKLVKCNILVWFRLFFKFFGFSGLLYGDDVLGVQH